MECPALKNFGLVVLLLLALVLARPASGAGVTIITHGYDGDINGWVTAMGAQLPQFFQRRFPNVQTNFAEYAMVVTTNKGGYMCTITNEGSSPTTTQSGEIIILLDWSQLAGGTAPYNITTSNVAWAVSMFLQQTNLFPPLNGHSVLELPIHLIGHSRGGSLISEISRDLGTNGVWVDHLTSLDPHPLNNDGDSDPFSVVDAPCHSYVNVLFHDEYWQDMGTTELDPDGVPVAGAYQRQLTSLNGGYSGIGFDPYEYHFNVHLWYQGTIVSSTPFSYNDGGTGVTFTPNMRTNWYVTYENTGLNTGLYYSLIGGGSRMSTDHPLGLPSDPAVVDGYNQNWDLGAGVSANRTALPNSGVWPNVIKFDVTGATNVTAGNLINTRLYYQYGGASNLTMQLYYDSDFNPYNSNNVPIVTLQPAATGTGSIGEYASLGLTSTNVPPGLYSIYARISDGVHTRYLYAPEQVQINSVLSPPMLDIYASGAQCIIGITSITGQTNVLQSSTNLLNWTPLATNILTASRWTFTNNATAGVQFYRAVLVP